MKNKILKLGLLTVLAGALCQGVYAQSKHTEEELCQSQQGQLNTLGAAAGESIANRGCFVFGRDYLRVYIEYVHLPQVKKQTSGVTVRVAVPNKEALKFPFALAAEPGQVYSGLGEWEVVPAVALNQKLPLEITQEVRTQRNRASSFSWVPDMLSTVAGLFTGGLSTRLTNLAGYSKTAQDVVAAYDKHTELSDINRFMLFPDALQNFYERPRKPSGSGGWGELRWISVFTKGTGKFQVWQEMPGVENYEKQPTIKIKEPEYACIQRDTNHRNPTSYSIKTKNPSKTYFPAGKEAYIILKFERFTPYPHLQEYPEVVPGVVPHFEALRSFFKAQRTTNPEESMGFQNLVDAEGETLVETLKTLTDTGALSLMDADTVFKAFIKKAKALNSDEKLDVFKADYLQKINPFPQEISYLVGP